MYRLQMAIWMEEEWISDFRYRRGMRREKEDGEGMEGMRSHHQQLDNHQRHPEYVYLYVPGSCILSMLLYPR